MRSARVLTVAAILTFTFTFSLGVPEATADPTKIIACPTTITAAGSYLLDASLTAIGTCITILTDFVTIDLSGHTLTGNGTGSGIFDGGAARRGISIYNGTVTNFHRGIDLINSTDGEVRKIRAIANANDGIRVGSRSTVSDNIANTNLNEGINANDDSTFERNTASGNVNDGIAVGNNNTIKNNTVTGNSDDGIIAGNSNTISHNTASGNVNNGILVGNNNTISHNTASGNTQDGIFAVDSGSNNTISHNTASSNGITGIHVGSANTISHNTASSNGVHGIVADLINTISNNTASSNGNAARTIGTGITANCSRAFRSNIFGNTAQDNDINGSVQFCKLSNNVGF